MNDAIELLKRVSTFSMLPDELLQSLAVNMKQRVCVNGELLFHSGDPGDSLFIIGSGQISVFLEISGRRLTLQEFGPGGAIGELALIDGNPRSASAMAIGETITWCLERETFRKALLEYPELVMVMLADLLVKLRFATSFIEEVVSWSRAVAEANYDDALEVIERAESEDMVRISGFLQAFSSMITEVKAREEAYQEEVNPQAPEKLDNFIREAQRIFTRLDGSMTSLIIGDKGSYFSVAFGAPVAHEDDAVRAAATALALHDLANGLPYLEAVQIGITSGRVRSGAYGSTTRRAYSIIGDPVNLSARLMAASIPGQSLAEEAVKTATGDRFVWESMPNMRVKGKRELVTVSRLVGQKRTLTTSRLEPQYQLPMVGRVQELALIQGKIDAALSGSGQIVAITAEAGMGKSRLAAEVIRAARQSGLTGLAGECQSYGTTTSNLVWQGVWRGFFDLDPALSLAAQVAALEKQLEALDPTLLPRLPLLGAVLNLAIPDNDLTRSLDAKVRKSSLEDLLLRLLEARSRIEPLLLILEDCHWVDDLSRELIGFLGKGVA